MLERVARLDRQDLGAERAAQRGEPAAQREGPGEKAARC